MAEKPKRFFGRPEGNYIHRHHVEPRVKLHVPKEWCFTLFALPTSDRVVTRLPLHLLHDFLYELGELAELLQPSILVLVSTMYESWCRDEIHVPTRCTVAKNYLYVWRRRSLPTSCLCFGTFDHRARFTRCRAKLLMSL